MKNIALILGAFAGVGNRANATPVPDFNAVEGQGTRADAISNEGFPQTDGVPQKTDYFAPVENKLHQTYLNQVSMNSNMGRENSVQPSPYQATQRESPYPLYNPQDPRNFNPTFPVSQPQYQYQYYPYWQNQANGNEPQGYEPKQQIESPVQATKSHQSLNLNNQQDPQEYRQPSFQDRVLETSNTEPAENSEVIDSEVIDSEVIDSEVIDSEVIDSEVINTELINTELINSELIDSELIDAVVVFDDFDCDLHEMPSVEDAQKKIQKYFFNSAYRFNGLNSIKILKREGKKTKKSECDSMIVHYQASVLKSRSRTPDFFREINIRIGLSFEDEHHSFGYKDRFRFGELYAFKISDFMNGLINKLRDEIDDDVENMIKANDYDVTTEHRRMEFKKLKQLIGKDEKFTKTRPVNYFDLNRLIYNYESHSDENEDNQFKLDEKFWLEKTRDERKKESRMPKRDGYEENTCTEVADGSTAQELIMKPENCNKRGVFISEPERTVSNYVAIDDLLAVLGEEEFMNKFIGIGNKKIATEIAQDKSDKEKKMKAAQYAIWKFVEDKTAREAEKEADLLPVAKKHVDDIEKLIEELTKQKKEIMEAENKPEDKNAGYNRWTKSLELIEDHEDYVKKLTKEYTDEHRKKELENAANDNLGVWLGSNGRPVQNAFFDWEWFNRSG